LILKVRNKNLFALKTSTSKYIFLSGAALVLIACSTKKDSFINRNYHAVTTEYNVRYNGEVALTAGLNELITTYNDDFWEVLPVERMQLTEEEMAPDDKKNPNFERAETKATKAIQKHSMNIGGSERNPQMDEAHLLLGKTRYYEKRFIPALEAFNYILYKYPTSDKIYEVKVWREKTNIRLENEAIAIKNLKALLKENVLDEQVVADANAILAQAYLNLEHKDSAVFVLKEAVKHTKHNEEKARYHFILGQLYSRLNHPDSAYTSFQTVIDMKRKSPRRYVIQAHAMQAGNFDHKAGDTLAFMEKYRDLLEDRENRPYLDVINHQVGLFYDKQGNDRKAVEHYNASLRKQTRDRYLVASNYRNIAEIHFRNAKYVYAGQYYDSTMTNLNSRTREYKNIKKKRDNLVDVIKYEGIAQTNDSILRLSAMAEPEKRAFFEGYIERLKQQEERERQKAEAAAKAAGNNAGGTTNLNAGIDPLFQNDDAGSNSPAFKGSPDKIGQQRVAAPGKVQQGAPVSGTVASGTSAGQGGNFYFYTPSTVAYGKLEFKKLWGNRPLVDNWRWSSELRNASVQQSQVTANDTTSGAVPGESNVTDERYTADYYIKQLPTSQTVLDSLAKERNFAYYQLGTIYKEKFKEYRRAADKLEKLLQNNPEERLVLPAKYNLYKIYQIIDPARAEIYKQQILNEYGDSRYAEIIRNPSSDAVNQGSPEQVYENLFKKFEGGNTREVAALTEGYIETYTGEEIVSKFELLKAHVTGRLEGLAAYKEALNFVALNYPNSTEGKQAETMLKTDIPALEKLNFGEPAITWKVIFKFDNPDDPKIKPLTEKIQKYIKEGLNNSITLSNDIYTTNENFIVIHGFNSKLAAQDAVSVLKDYKTYKVAETPIIISTEDYKVVQIKKNLTEFLAIK
jgi:tetratricopeptide (TPR) repeat protein